MINILEKIVETKKGEVERAREIHPVEAFRNFPFYNRACISAVQSIRSGDNTGIIAEFKRRSPSKGWINQDASLADVVEGYQKGGAAAISVLTDTDYFGGSLHDLGMARGFSDLPLLRKDFVIDAYQIHEAKAAGADFILLIAAILQPDEVKKLASEAHDLGLEVLLEIHEESEINHVVEGVDLVGINNRNLKNFEVNIEQSIRLQHLLPAHLVKVAESGIHSLEIALELRNSGFDSLLMGEFFMKQKDPATAFEQFAVQLQQALLAKAGSNGRL
jgi:indole-3-glycerol phosphate synthase